MILLSILWTVGPYGGQTQDCVWGLSYSSYQTPPFGLAEILTVAHFAQELLEKKAWEVAVAPIQSA